MRPGKAAVTSTASTGRMRNSINPSNAELNPICHLLALLGADHIFHVSGLRVNPVYLKLLIYVARQVVYQTTQHMH